MFPKTVNLKQILVNENFNAFKDEFGLRLSVSFNQISPQQNLVVNQIEVKGILVGAKPKMKGNFKKENKQNVKLTQICQTDSLLVLFFLLLSHLPL